MDFEYSAKTRELMQRVDDFMQQHVYPVEPEYDEFVHDPANRWVVPPSMAGLKAKARAAGLWNLFLPHEYGKFSPGLTNLEYAPLAELMGRVEWSSEVFNCSAPDTGNMEVLARYGQRRTTGAWLKPLLEGTLRSAYVMTEPQVASSDATNVECSIVRDGAELRAEWPQVVVEQYLSPGLRTDARDGQDPLRRSASHPAVDDHRAAQHAGRESAATAEGASGRFIRRAAHGEVLLEDVRVPASNLILGEGRGFEIAQGRLGPGASIIACDSSALRSAPSN